MVIGFGGVRRDMVMEGLDEGTEGVEIVERLVWC